MSNLRPNKQKPILFAIMSVMLILSILTITGSQFKGNYAFARASIQRTMEVKVDFNNLVEAGSKQNIRVKATDLGTGDPISGASVRITVYFPAGAPIRQFTLLTGKDGQASLTLPIDRNAVLGTYGLDVLVSALGYFDTAVGTVSWAVMSQVDQNVDLHDYKHTSHTISDHAGNNNHHHNHNNHHHNQD
ncbi:MAG TPA: hypothetical protein VH796_03550 [Nitrososphaeraceae archaeon]|jgi:hypothetical protein